MYETPIMCAAAVEFGGGGVESSGFFECLHTWVYPNARRISLRFFFPAPNETHSIYARAGSTNFIRREDPGARAYSKHPSHRRGAQTTTTTTTMWMANRALYGWAGGRVLFIRRFHCAAKWLGTFSHFPPLPGTHANAFSRYKIIITEEKFPLPSVRRLACYARDIFFFFF